MNSSLLLRVAAVLTFIHSVLHTIGGVFGKTPPGPATIAVETMKANQFLVMGNMRTYWAFQRGLGLGITIALTAESILFWQLGSLAKTDALRVRPILFTFMIAYAVLAANSYTYFFIAQLL
jgi:hypothetical protein